MQVIQRDGVGEGYDLELIRLVSDALTVSLVACSGVGRFEHYAEGIAAGASAGKESIGQSRCAGKEIITFVLIFEILFKYVYLSVSAAPLTFD